MTKVGGRVRPRSVVPPAPLAYSERVPAPRPVSPRPTRFGETWRIALAAVLGAIFFLAEFPSAPSTGPAAVRALVDLLLGTAVIVSLHWRRRRPIAIGVAATAATVLSAMALPATLLIVASLVSSRGWRIAAAVAGLGVAAALPSQWLMVDPADETPWWQLLLASVVVYGAAFGFGLYVRARRELVETRRERELTAEREQASRLAEARANERSRIAREMHDVLAHRISLVAMHAGAMTYRTDLTRDQLLDSARVVQDNAHQALADLRDVLGVLRDPAAGEPGPPLPQPTLDDLPALVREVQAAGTAVTLDPSSVDVSGVPDLAGRTAYRIVQEALTNARKHAPGAAVTIRLSGTAGGELGVEVANPLPVLAATVPGAGTLPGAGVGLVGLRERAELAGGALTFREADDGTFVVRAALPWPR